MKQVSVTGVKLNGVKARLFSSDGGVDKIVDYSLNFIFIEFFCFVGIEGVKNI